MSAEETAKRPRGTVSIDADVMDLLVDEQFRLRKAEGKKLSYSEIVRRWAAQAGQSGPAPVKKKAKHGGNQR